MKKITFLTALVAIIAINNSSKAQLSMGAHTNFTHYFAGYGNSLGLGLSGEFSRDEDESSFRGAFTYGTPSTYNNVESLDPIMNYSNYTSAPARDVDVTYKLSYMQFSLDYKYYLGRNSGYQDGGFYVFLGAGLQMAKATTTVGTYDTNLYSYSGSTEPERLFQPVIRGGSGFEVEAGPGFIYGEGFLNVPANNVNGVYVDINLPISLGIQLGYRILF